MNREVYSDEKPPRREILSGGAVLLTRSIAGAHSVALGFWLRGGSQDEEASNCGATHLLEHLVFKGSHKRSAFEIASELDSLGVAVDAFTTKDHMAFTLQVLPEYLGEACEVFADMLLCPAIDSSMLSLEQDIVCEEIQEALDTPEDRLHDAFAARLYRDHPRGRPILGTEESVRSFVADFLRRQHRNLFAGSNVVISMAGDINDASVEVVRRCFRFPSAVNTDEQVAVRNDIPEAPEPSRLSLSGTLIQTYFEIGNRAISFHHVDRIPLVVLANILGGGMSSRIFQAVREREGLAYSIYTYCDLGREVGMVSTAGSCSPGKIDRVEEIVRNEFTTLLRDGIVSAEIEASLAQIKSQLVFSLEGPGNQMQRAARNELYFGRFLPVAELIERVDAVTGEDLMRCATRYFDPAELVVAVHRPVG